MQDINILKGNIGALRERARELRIKLRALKEQCRHPKALICYSPERTRCAACNKTLWSPTGDSFWSGQAHLSAEELQNISVARSRLKPELDSAETGIKKLEELCPHPESEKMQSPHPDYPDECGICGKEWSEVQTEREKIVTPD